MPEKNAEEKSVGIIILNYINYSETEGCIESILAQEYDNYHVVIVDNGSANGSYEYLKRLYKNEKTISVIKTGKNYGFAKGNNVGIHYLKKKWKPEYLLLLNSDVVLDDPRYITRLVGADEIGVGVIGSKIIQFGERKIFKTISRYVTFPGTLWYYGKLITEYRDIYIFQDMFDKLLEKCKCDELLQGCALLLTPEYLKYYSGLDSRTFLYCEEELLYLRCKRAGLRQKFVEDLTILHKGKQSSQELYSNRRKGFLKHLTASYKFVLLESLKNIFK